MPTDEEVEPYLITSTSALRAVSEYSGLNFNEAVELDCYTFKVLVRDSFIYRMSKTEQGRDYLEDCWILTQTTPDRKSLRDHFGKGGK